jgi:uncharacterized LabA/DUF88 family protein
MKKDPASIAYIDGANLDKAVRRYYNVKMDYGRFRVWLKDKYKVQIAYIFIGYISQNEKLYNYLRKSGFTLMFRQVIYNKKQNIYKGNCDTDLVVKACSDFYENKLNKAVLISSDGDYLPLINKFKEYDSIGAIISPSPPNKCSVLLKRSNVPIVYLSDFLHKFKSK